jgi:hypothetical protein
MGINDCTAWELSPSSLTADVMPVPRGWTERPCHGAAAGGRGHVSTGPDEGEAVRRLGVVGVAHWLAVAEGPITR